MHFETELIHSYSQKLVAALTNFGIDLCHSFADADAVVGHLIGFEWSWGRGAQSLAFVAVASVGRMPIAADEAELGFGPSQRRRHNGPGNPHNECPLGRGFCLRTESCSFIHISLANQKDN
jgi:hypothetical protein